MVGSLTVLPALLHRLGEKVDKGRLPIFGGRPRDDGTWGRIVGGVLRRPVLWGGLSAALLLALALPAVGMRTKLPNYTDLPKNLKIVRTFERIQKAFPGSQTPVVVVVKAPTVDTPRMQRAYATFRTRAVATGEFFAPFTLTVNPLGTRNRLPRCTRSATRSSRRSPHGRPALRST
jgi:RND superfamily putative drug exporter